MAGSRADRTSESTSASHPAGLLLRPLRAGDEAVFRAGHEALKADDFTFGLEDFDVQPSWAAYLDRLADIARAIDLATDRVPATFLAADVDGELVGRISIRHRLTPWLRAYGGHIGYGVLPAHRRRGYASEILGQGLVVARSLGVDRALLICREDNTGSRAVIERHGGVLDSTALDEEGVTIRRYWIG